VIRKVINQLLSKLLDSTVVYMIILTAKNVSKYFGGLAAVSDTNLEINEGEILGLIGPNGSGKTTFLNLINGILKPTTGKITFQDQDITGFPAHILARRGIARTFQQNVLFRRAKVWENVLVAHEVSYQVSPWWSFFDISGSRIDEKEAQQSTLSILDEMNLRGWKDKLCNDLPHGIQRMVVFAVATAVKPKLLLLDEPFAGLNLSDITNMGRRIKKLRGDGTTILMVEHRMKAVMELCERIVVLNFGRKIAEGLPEEIRNNEEVIKAYLGEKTRAF
jgi:branched-chain amino acid transport system ATP-binding protein